MRKVITILTISLIFAFSAYSQTISRSSGFEDTIYVSPQLGDMVTYPGGSTFIFDGSTWKSQAIQGQVSGAESYTFDYAGVYDTTPLATLNNFAFLNNTTGYNFTPVSNFDITGFQAESDNTVHLLINTGTGDLKFKHNNANSAVGNRIFTFEGGGDKSFKQYSSTYIIYKQSLDGGNGGWLLIEMQH